MRCAITDHKPMKSLWVFMGSICTEKVSSDYMDYMNLTADQGQQEKTDVMT